MYEQIISWWNEPALAHWNCCGFSSWLWFLDRLLPYAPLITAAIAISAGLIAVLSIQAQKKIARRRAAIDLFLKTDLDAAMVAAYGSFNSNIAALQNPIVEDKAYRSVLDYLNIHQLISVGIDNKVFDERICYNHWAGVLVRHCKAAENVIAHACESKDGAAGYTYYDLRRRNKKWARRLDRWIKWHDANGKLRWPYRLGATATPTQALALPAVAADQNVAQPTPETIDQCQSAAIKPTAPGVVQLLVSCDGQPPLQSTPILLMCLPTAPSTLHSSGAGTTTE